MSRHSQWSIKHRYLKRGVVSLVRWSAALALVIACLVAARGGSVAAQPQRPPAAQDEFVPMKEIPPEDQLPAAPLLIAAYGVAWLAIAAYVWLLWRQLGRVERELQTLGARLSARDR